MNSGNFLNAVNFARRESFSQSRDGLERRRFYNRAKRGTGHRRRMTQAYFTKPSVQDVLADPRWFLEDYHEDIRKLRFIHAGRDELARQAFLSEGLWDYAALPKAEFAESAVSGHMPHSGTPPQLNFIWHTAFCCSTLIARALDKPGVNLSLKEPGILLTLAEAKRQNAIGSGKPFSWRLAETVFRLMDRPFHAGEKVTVKPPNLANHALREAIQLTRGKHLFLYSDCRSFLVSVAKKHDYGRTFARELFARIVGDGNEQEAWPLTQTFRLTDLRAAAIAWHMQIAEIQRNWSLLAPGRAVSLDCDAFLSAPEETLAKVDDFLELGLGRAHLAQVMTGPVLSRHSKSAITAFAVENRRAEHDRIAADIGVDLDQVVAWSYQLCRSTPRGAPLADPLVTLDKAYHP